MPAPIIALLTDFGISDPYVAIMKGVIKQICPQCEIIDITHQIEPFNILQGKFILENSFLHFPPKTIFTTVIDPGVGSERKAIAAKQGDFFFIAPDNGLLSFLKQNHSIYEINNPNYFYHPLPSHTFHGRDIFAPASAYLANGIKIENLGNPVKKIIAIPDKTKIVQKNQIQIPLIHIDHFGNLIFNIKKNDLEKMFQPEKNYIFFSNSIFKEVVDTYSQLTKVGCLFNSFGYLEIACKNGSAASLFKINKIKNNYLYIQ